MKLSLYSEHDVLRLACIGPTTGDMAAGELRRRLVATGSVQVVCGLGDNILCMQHERSF